jgi:hypothetical protein
MIIKVTEEHVKNGRRKSRGYCPIALALKDEFGTDCDPRVGDWYIFIGTHKEPYYTFNWIAKSFVDRFDAGGWCPPIEFELTPMVRP